MNPPLTFVLCQHLAIRHFFCKMGVEFRVLSFLPQLHIVAIKLPKLEKSPMGIGFIPSVLRQDAYFPIYKLANFSFQILIGELFSINPMPSRGQINAVQSVQTSSVSHSP
jgi:hypothetical protein